MIDIFYVFLFTVDSMGVVTAIYFLIEYAIKQLEKGGDK